jgi:LuxR family maltose regulon positive regulatory protein
MGGLVETLRLCWLGHPLVELEGRAVKLETRKATALLSYLSLTPGNCQRELLATMFWPEGNQQKALANFRRTLSSLNASLPGWIEADRERVALKHIDRLWIDVLAFHQYLSQLQQHDCVEKEICDNCLAILEKAAGLYRGEFLEGLNLDDAPDFDEWQFFQRDSLRQELATTLQHLSAGYTERKQWEPAIACARRWVALDRLHEPAQRVLIDLYARAGQRTAALRHYEELTRLLKEELGQVPEQETQRLYEQIRGREDAKQVKKSFESLSAFPLLKTKLYIPAAPASRVIRSELINRLTEVEKKALTIISAPAGFGKTTLLAEWIAQTTLPVAWLSLDIGDNDPNRFMAYLIKALESIQEGVGIEAQQFLQSQQPVPSHILLASLINDLGKITEPYVLVLDDYQFVTEHAVHETMAYLLDHIPTTLHVIIATRADPPLQLGRLRAYGQMLELRTQDMRFSPEETVEFLNEVMRLGLSTEDIEALETRTEGWVVGLKMAALSLKGNQNASEFIRAFSGNHRYVLDYLLEEVLKRQPTHIQTFLLYTSILEQLNGPLCDVLMSEEWRKLAGSGQEILEYLEKSNLFVIPLDEHKQWYRYHHLFADLLRAQLLKFFENQEIAQLHLRASDWYEQNGPTLQAIHHASLAADFERIEHLIENNYMEIVNRGEMSWLRFWTGQLSKEMLYSRPWLCIYEAQSCAWFGELDEAHRLLEEAEKRIQVLASEGQAMLGHLAYVKSRVTAMRGDIERAIDLCLAARKLIPASNLGLQLDISMTLAYEYFLSGDYHHAEPSLREMIQTGGNIGSIINTVAAYCVMARLYAVRGMLKKSYELYQTAAQMIPQASGQHFGAKAMVEVGIGDLLCEWNEIDQALVHVKQGLDLMPWWGKTDDFVLAYLTLARIYLAQANKKDAKEAVEKASQLIQTRGVFSEARNAVEIFQVKLWLAQGNMQAAQRWAASQEGCSGFGDRYRIESELSQLARARLFIAQNRPVEAIGLLSDLEENARSGGRQSRLIEIMIIKTLALKGRGSNTQADLVLTKALKLAEPEGYMRIFLDEGEPIIFALKRLRESNLIPRLKGYMNRLLESDFPPK